MVAREIELAGGRILERGTDGRSHRTVTFEIDGKQERFHFPSSGRTNGCGLNNGRARLRRVIKALASSAEPVNDIQEQIKGEESMQLSEALELAAPVSMNKARRREIAARYLEVEAVRDIMEEFDLFYDEAVRAIKLAGGAAARKVKEEIALRIQIEKAVGNINEGKPVVLPKKVEKVLKAMKEEAEEMQDTVEAEPAKTNHLTAWRADVSKTYAEKFPGAIVHEAADSFSIDIPCTGCGVTHEAAYVAEAAEPPYKVLKTLRDSGWKIGETTQRYSCPIHTADKPHKAKKDQPAAAPPADDLGTVSEAPPAPVVQEAPPPAKRAADIRAARRAVIHWLDECFDLKHNCYKAGMSDAQIASEVGLHEVEVSAIREDLYGPLGPPEEFVEMLAKIAQIEDDIQSMSEAFTQQVVTMMKEASALRSEFDKHAKANGWVE